MQTVLVGVNSFMARGKGHKNMVALTVGTGLGGAIVLDGKLSNGSYGMAAEFGHLPMVSMAIPVVAVCEL